MRPRLLLAAAAALAAVALASPLPVVDEENHLAIAAQLVPWRPYDWWRAGLSWVGGPEPDAFVYAHPPLFPLWIWLWSRITGFSAEHLPALKIAAAVPWAGLLGWSVGALAERLSPRPWLTCALWLCAPITLLGIQRGLMPDLMVTALGTFAVVGWLHAPNHRSWAIVGGLALAGACWTKYPAALLALAMLLGDRAPRRRFWLAAALPLLLGEGALWLQYGRPHLWEVLGRAGEIPRGPLDGRALGTLVRLSLGVTVLPMAMRGWRWLAPAAAAVLAPLVLLGSPRGSPLDHQIALLGWALPGAVALGLLVRGTLSTGPTRMLSAWGGLAVVGVILGHNFAAPRYLLPAMAPLALLLCQAIGQRADARGWIAAGLALQGALALAITHAEHAFATAQDAAARAAIAAHPTGGAFSGEWTFRWRLEQAGWTLLQTPTSGAVIARSEHASSSAPDASWIRSQRIESPQVGDLRIICAPCGVGLYGETIGPLPLAFAPGPLATITLWRTP